MKILSYIVAFAIGAIALIPPVDVNYPLALMPWEYVCVVLFAALFGGYYLFTSAPGAFKALCLLLFVGCFFSKAPAISFIAYVSLVAAAYFFLYLRDKFDFNILIRVLEVVFWLQMILAVLQFFGKDTLLNFNKPETKLYGTVFNSMRLATVVACIAPFLILKNIRYFIALFAFAIFSQSMGLVLALACGLSVYASCTWRKQAWWFTAVLFITVAAFYFTSLHCLHRDWLHGRSMIWFQTFKEVFAYPYTGWGMGTYKVFSPVLHNSEVFLQAHNDWLQMAWEIGLPSFVILLFCLADTVRLIIWQEKTIALCGITIIAACMFFHFPMRMYQTPLIMLAFLAYCKNFGG